MRPAERFRLTSRLMMEMTKGMGVLNQVSIAVANRWDTFEMETVI